MEEIILDDPEVEKIFQSILRQVKARQNGKTAGSMKKKGVQYKVNWGVSVMDLREIAAGIDASHLLALKLWNKQWRESMILASMLDDPKMVSEKQMDIWTKSIENTEIAEHLVANLWVKSPFAFIKALEWCRGKKHIVRFAGLQLMGRLAMVDKNSIDEMFEPFFEVLEPLAKDPVLNTVFYRSFNLLGSRSKQLNIMAVDFARNQMNVNSENAKTLAINILEELTGEYVQEKITVTGGTTSSRATSNG